MTRFYIQDQGVFIPTNDLAQAFAALNFKQNNSLGIGTDTLFPVVNPENPNWIADIQTQDFWGFVGVGSSAPIYRLTNVGVGTNNIFERFQVGATGSDLVITGPDNVLEGLVGIGVTNPIYKLDVFGDLHASQDVQFDQKLNVDGATTLNDTLDVDGATTLNDTLDVDGATTLNSTLDVDGLATFNDLTDATSTTLASVQIDGGVGIVKKLFVGSDTKLEAILDVDGATTLNNTLDVDGATTLNNTLDVDGATTLNNTLDVDGATTLNDTLDVDGNVTFNSTTQSTDKDTGALITQGGVGIEKNLNVGENAKIYGTLELDSSLIDVNNSTATGKYDYRLSSVGTGVSWRPPGVQTQNIIYVTKDGNDENSGLLEGDAKATVGAAASIAQDGDTIYVRPGVYFENNPIGLRTDVTISGQDLRLVTIIPSNPTKDVFHVRRGCLIENLNFAGTSVSVAHTGASAVAFPPLDPSKYAATGYVASGPANEGPTGRWRSPYVRNCTNFMTGSIGMKIDGNHASADFSGTNIIGNDLKCMVCDSFTQYNEAGIGVSITNNGYAQLVSIFTINCDIGIYVASGGSCDLTNSNSSFGNYGLYAVGLGATEFTATVGTYPPTRTQPGVDAGSDKVTFNDMKDVDNNPRTPYDGQALFFKINLDNYPEAVGTGVIQDPMVQIDSIRIINGGYGFSATSPPTVLIRDADDLSQNPKGPQGIIAELSPTVDEITGAITAIDIVNSGRNYLASQNLEVFIDGGDLVGASAEVITQPIYYTIDYATEPTLTGITTVTFNEFVPYELFGGEEVSLKRISRILTSSHSFEYIGTGTNINTATPFQGAVPIKDNEVVALDGAQIPFTSTDQKGNFDIGEGFQINQPTATIRGRDFSKAIQAEVTPLILALR